MAAQGWLELGNETEAFRELEKIAPELRFHPDVVKLRWRIFGRKENWQTVLKIARTICSLEPVASTSEFNLDEHRFARRVPAVVAKKVPHVRNGAEAIGLPELFAIPYNLACYACQLGNVNEAWEWFKMAAGMSDRDELRRIALNDPDLEPLWARISRF